jgi:hypothetical protein
VYEGKLVGVSRNFWFWYSGGQPTAQIEVSAAQTRVEDQLFFDISGNFLLKCGPKSQYFWQIFQVAAQRLIWVSHPWFSEK